MTKAEMIARLQNREAENWLDVISYLRVFTEGMTSEQVNEFKDNDIGYRRKLAKWVAISDMLDELGIRSDDEHPANLEAAGLICRG